VGQVSLRAVEKRYDNGYQAIKPLDLEIQEGELLVLVGPSGCGKSTLLRSIAGLESLSGGEILLRGQRIDTLSPAKRDIAMVFQNYALYPHMTVYDNMAYGLKNRGVSKDDIQLKIAQAAQMLQLTDYLERKPQHLSGGQRQRVAMGRAIVRNPKLFLFDEPLSNLDAKLRTHMRLEIRKLQRQLKVTSIYVTHDQVEALTLADRIVVLNQGVIEQVGTPKQLYYQPRSLFVAGFIGSPAMNFWEGIYAGGAQVTLPLGGVLTIDASVAALLTEGLALKVGIRPEDVILEHWQRSNQVSQENPFEYEVSIIEPMGAMQLLHGECGGLELMVSTSDEYDVAQGRYPVYLPMNKLHLFDAQSGERITSEK
jgi:sn-glycerol 3-phosphate transport system ATP-binding protein